MTEEIIDLIHLKIKKYFEKGDLDNYISVFSDDLKYIQKDGKTICKQQLFNNQKRYFPRIIHSESNYYRTSFKQENNFFIETLEQKAKISIRVFILFKKIWKIERTATYYWKNINDEYKVYKVEVLDENKV